MAGVQNFNAFSPRTVINLLLVKNDQQGTFLIEKTILSGSPKPFKIYVKGTIKEAIEFVSCSQVDIVVLDLCVPDCGSLTLLRELRAEVEEGTPIFAVVDQLERGRIEDDFPLYGIEPLYSHQLEHYVIPTLFIKAVDKHQLFLSMQRLVRANPDGIIVVNLDGIVIFNNSKSCSLFNKRSDELKGHLFGFPVVAGSAVDITTITGRTIEMRSTDIEWNGQLAFIITLRDVTDRVAIVKELEKAKAELELATRVREEILMNMNHEVRTPLNSIIGFSDILLTNKGGLSDENMVISYLESIRESGWALLDMLTDVMDMANVRTNNFDLTETIFDLEIAMQNVIRIVHSQITRSKLSLEVVVPETPIQLQADFKRFKQMLAHLLSNAIKFNVPGGSVQVCARNGSRGELLVSVIDTGIGIDIEDTQRIGVPFNRVEAALTAKTSGPGLGLSLTKGLIERHGGYMTIESEVGKGTAVTLTFPPSRLVHKGSGDLPQMILAS